MPTLIDSNVLIDLVSANGDWSGWSSRELVRAASEGAAVINQIVYAETAAYFTAGHRFDQALASMMIQREDLPWAAAREAGMAHAAYRKNSGRRERVLPDFLIGAHAALMGYALLTRDAARYLGYFPALAVIAPDSHP